MGNGVYFRITQPLLKFVRIICKRNCPETADLVAGLLLQLSKSLEAHLTNTFWGGSDDLRDWKKLLDTFANQETSTNVSLLAQHAGTDTDVPKTGPVHVKWTTPPP